MADAAAALAGCAMAAVLLAACGGMDETQLDGVPSRVDEDLQLGSLEMALSFNEVLSLRLLQWRIEGNGYTGEGTIEVGQRPTVVARIGGIPVGEGYTLWLASNDTTMSCSGTAQFVVRKASTTPVRAEVQCTLTAETGQLTITAPINVCPVVRGLSALPLELAVGETARLRAEVRDLDQGPGRSVVRWESTGGTLASDGLEATLTCVNAGQYTVRVFVSDGACEASAAVALPCVTVQRRRSTWPGAQDVKTVDPPATFVSNISGAAYLSGSEGGPGTLWVVQNGPSRIFPLYPAAGGTYALATEGPWRAGKFITYPDGGGEPDTEGLTFAGTRDTVYVATERDNAQSGTSRLSILRVVLDDESVLRASHEWNLTEQLPRVGANTGLEGIAWIPDEYLVGRGFFDERAGAAYAPGAYPDHAGGLFFVGVEADGMIHALALSHTSGVAQRIASFSSGQAQVMDLQFDGDTGLLWALCDDTCQGEMTALGLSATAAREPRGRFQVLQAFARPQGMPNLNNEGLAIAPASECNAGLKPIFWTDDGSTAGHSVRSGLMPCGPLD